MVPQACRLLLLAALCALAGAQMPGKKEKVLPVMSDIKHIDCAVCGEVVRVVHRTVSAMRKELPAGKKVRAHASFGPILSECAGQSRWQLASLGV